MNSKPVSLDRLGEIATELAHSGLCGSAQQVRAAEAEIRHLRKRHQEIDDEAFAYAERIEELERELAERAP